MLHTRIESVKSGKLFSHHLKSYQLVYAPMNVCLDFGFELKKKKETEVDIRARSTVPVD
ncbi:hypothetical protein F511_08481 [Dorcoceras hygrometricum]|uniref:Uncharacterized protein n=1 Tax=Dorcoceras hygrometricum TaxID=472368 RepID=A0A2Z7ABT0_9LAMI|nr:hypothetical protein F511_08481 [Dorcoceras hygrometricum]